MQMTQPSTLTSRITKHLIFWVGLVWAISAIGVAAYVKYEIDEAFDQALLDNVLQLDEKSRLAESMEHRIHAFWETMRWLFLPMMGFLPVLALLVHRIVRRELLPVQQLTHQIAERGGQNLNPIRAETGFPTELTTIVDSTNRLLERMNAALDVERSLAANAAHELRTPIATARLRIDNALHYDLPDEVKLELEAAVVGLDRLSRRTEKLLQLSRAEGSKSLISEHVDLALLVSLVVQEFWEDDDAKERLRMYLPDLLNTTKVIGDMDTLALALRNLIENALRHAPASQVEVRVTASLQETVFISITDKGAGVDADHLALLTHRHVRQSQNQTGYGLGLSIVKTIVERHKGVLSFASPPQDLPHGFEAGIVLAKSASL
jgi:two-component system, OmpR family, sensor kinase